VLDNKIKSNSNRHVILFILIKNENFKFLVNNLCYCCWWKQNTEGESREIMMVLRLFPYTDFNYKPTLYTVEPKQKESWEKMFCFRFSKV
jgi:hypothetical protein